MYLLLVSEEGVGHLGQEGPGYAGAWFSFGNVQGFGPHPTYGDALARLIELADGAVEDFDGEETVDWTGVVSLMRDPSNIPNLRERAAGRILGWVYGETATIVEVEMPPEAGAEAI